MAELGDLVRAAMIIAAVGMTVSMPATAGPNGFGFTFTSIEGDELPLSKFAGRPMLVVNTASECGYTPQYADLVKLWQGYRNKGLIVLGVPSNDFGGQEPGSEAQIKGFCEVTYGVDFPMTEKQAVIGGKAHPFYKWIVAELGEGAAPRWNFHKYLIGPDGAIAGAWPSSVSPISATITKEIDKLLKP
ncbi:MAG: glutathione peroxidase [Alphaproteobacteria bacterium]|nr:glutathione peroxidase [Alphaproteobacteria bacterium]